MVLLRNLALSLEGNIGAGKTTLVRLLQARGMLAVGEPVDRWQAVPTDDGSDGNLLQRFYDDPPRWGFTFQTYAFLTRAQAAATARRATDAGGACFVLERSLASDKHCFARNTLRGVEWAVYADYHAWVEREFPETVADGVVYLRTSPATCLRRSQRRGRSEEDELPLDYLTELHARHENWLLPSVAGRTPLAPPLDMQRAASTGGTPVLVLDCDREFEADTARQRQVVDAVCEFAASLGPIPDVVVDSAVRFEPEL